MGAGQSSAAAGAMGGAAQQQLLQRLAGPEAIPLAAPFWDQLFSLGTQPLAALDPEDVEAALAPHCRQLLVHNPLTRNFQSLLLHVMELLAAAQGGAPSLPAANALHLTAVLLKVVAETAAPSTLAAVFEVGPNMPATHQGQSSLAPMFLNRVVQLLINCKPSADETAYLLVIEALLLLVVCCSTQLYSPTTAAPPDAHPLAEALMAQRDAAPALVSALLSLVVDRCPQPPRLALHKRPDAAGGYAVVRLVRSAAATVFYLPVRTLQFISTGPASCTASGATASAAAAAAAAAAKGGGGAAGGGGMMGGRGGGAVAVASPVSDLALVALLLLAHFPAQQTGRANCVREALDALQDLQLPTSTGGAPHLATVVGRISSASFARLYAFFSSGPPSEATTLLLYTLLHGCRAFREYVLVRSDTETLLLPLLGALYGASAASANHLYMLQIVVLILSQDAAFSNNIHRVILPGAPWYRERPLGRVSLGSLVYTVLLRTAAQNFGQLRDLYLPTNTLAALANLAPHVSGLHPHAAQRLLGLASVLAKRYDRVVRKLESLPGGAGGQQQQQQQNGAAQAPQQQQGGQQAAAAAAGQAGLDAASLQLRERLAQDEEVLAGFLRIVLEVINTILAVGLQRNPDLVYAVLHKQDMLLALRSHPRLRELVDNIAVVVDYFNARLDATDAGGRGGGGKGGGGEQLATVARPRTSQPDWSVREVLELVQGFSQGWRGDRLRPLAEMRFVYEEEAAPEEFFVPFIWSLAVAATNDALLHWDLGAMALLTPLAVGSDGAELEPQFSTAASTVWSDDGALGGMGSGGALSAMGSGAYAGGSGGGGGGGAMA
ncbi:hypothetical protein Rsub_13274 [Raphidocelis subcapitata]|uniref:Dymeclin n=1 Tax=Raphidocelis subcapitata TaxID=307507 RepID=A0A2V0PR42_9CHLO|nr:hypothetical protein Rsub_13274 [Raphidocelis subcapitata]|eukprot:GBG00571.1 hypothetical protein Rsub_13274 [Raphidocelis subcapitata]